ncbi:MAG TPA: glycosyl hydrolase family 28 protein [Pseudonocardiaceae bacterium]|nr:glycosyl hydrolase family 28 protein [Pseudonocardiaceae bacterium]
MMRLGTFSGAFLLASAALLGIPVVANASGSTTVATGDSRTVSQPTVPGVCAPITSGLAAPGNRKFSSGQESAPPDTARITAALSKCAGSGKAVELKANGGDTAFLSGPLTINAGETLLVDSGVTLYASLNAKQYQVSGKPTCGTVASSEGGCRPFLTVSGANAAVMGTSVAGSQGRIDGRGDLTIYGGSESWWQLAQDAKAQNKQQNDPRLLVASGNNFVLYDIDLLNSPNFHVVFQNATGFTAWGVRIKTPASARNTDGIDPSGATDVTIANSYIQDGDDGVAIKGGSASKNITIRDDHFYGTHGISIGSETNGGVTNVLVENNTVQGTDSSGITSTSDNGIRIKSDSSRGGKVSQITYDNTCLSGVKYLLDFDTHYSSSTGSKIPYFTDIVVDGARSVSSASSAESVLDGYSSAYPLGLTLQNVSLDVTKTTAEYAKIGVYNTNITASGTGVTVSGVPGSGGVPNCSFPAYPGL